MNNYKQDLINVCGCDLPWEKLEGQNILVTGATGLIGGCLIDVLMMNPNRNYHVFASGRNVKRALSRFNNYIGDSFFHFIRYDVMEPLESDSQFHYIIHAASNASPYFFANNPVEVMVSNIEGTRNLVEYGLKHQMKRFLYISSGEIYGEGDGREFTEDYQGYVNINLPRSCYPSAKRATETMCAAYGEEYNADIVIARPCHVYGPHFAESDNRAYAQFIRNVINNEDIVMKSTGQQNRSWCYVVDCVSALLFILLKGEKGEAYNVADDKSNISIKELAELIAQIGNRKVVFDIPSEDEARGYNVVTKSVFSTVKLKKMGWSPNGDIINNLKSTIFECKNERL